MTSLVLVSAAPDVLGGGAGAGAAGAQASLKWGCSWVHRG